MSKSPLPLRRCHARCACRVAAFAEACPRRTQTQTIVIVTGQGRGEVKAEKAHRPRATPGGADVRRLQRTMPINRWFRCAMRWPSRPASISSRAGAGGAGIDPRLQAILARLSHDARADAAAGWGRSNSPTTMATSRSWSRSFRSPRSLSRRQRAALRVGYAGRRGQRGHADRADAAGSTCAPTAAPSTRCAGWLVTAAFPAGPSTGQR